MRKYLVLFVASVLMAGTASTAVATDWVLDRDFSQTTNPNGQWTYGVYLEDGFDPVAFPGNWLTWPQYHGWPGLEGMFGYWGNPGGDLGAGAVFHTDSDTPYLSGDNQWWAPHKVMLFPAGAGNVYAPVVRWTAPADMRISVDALFVGCEDGTNTDVHILLNGNMNNGPVFVGTHLLDGIINGNYGYAPLGVAATGTSNHVAYNGELDVAAGDILDFVVGYGEDLSYTSDLTGLDVTITKIADTTDWVLDRDFSKTTNPHRRWTYGVYLADSWPGPWLTWPTYRDWPGTGGTIGYWGSPGGDLGPGCIFYTNSDTPFLGGGNQWWAPRKVMMFSAAAGWGYAPVIRWTTPADMQVSVDASFYGCEDGTNTDVHILLNGDMTDGPNYSGTHLLDGIIDGNYGYAPLGVAASGTSNHVAYNAILNLKAGDTLDFVVGYGEDQDYGSDLTGLDVTITKGCQNVPWADVDGDHDVDAVDFGLFQLCYTGQGGAASGGCLCLDHAGANGPDGAIDAMDLDAFLSCWTGPMIESTGCP